MTEEKDEFEKEMEKWGSLEEISPRWFEATYRKFKPKLISKILTDFAEDEEVKKLIELLWASQELEHDTVKMVLKTAIKAHLEGKK